MRMNSLNPQRRSPTFYLQMKTRQMHRIQATDCMENYGLDKTWDQAHVQKYMGLIGPGFDDLGVREGDEK